MGDLTLTPQAKREKARALVKPLFFNLLSTNHSPAQAVELLLIRIAQHAPALPPEVVSLTAEDLWDFADYWEMELEAETLQAAEAEGDSPFVDPKQGTSSAQDPARLTLELHVEHLRSRVLQAEEALDRAAKVLLPVSADVEVVSGAYQDYERAYKVWRQITVDLVEAEDQLSRASASSLRDWEADERELIDSLSEHYRVKDRGPHYEILIRRLARAEMRFEQLEAAGVVVPTAEYDKLTATVVAAIKQLQSHTEATKSETVRTEVGEAVGEALKIVEEKVAPTQPQLFQEIARAVVARVAASQAVA